MWKEHLYRSRNGDNLIHISFFGMKTHFYRTLLVLFRKLSLSWNYSLSHKRKIWTRTFSMVQSTIFEKKGLINALSLLLSITSQTILNMWEQTSNAGVCLFVFYINTKLKLTFARSAQSPPPTPPRDMCNSLFSILLVVRYLAQLSSWDRCSQLKG